MTEHQHQGLAGLDKQEYEPSIAQSNVRSVVSQSPFEYLVKQFKQYQPRSQLLDLPRMRASQHLKLKKYRESAFYGQIVNGKRHGQGVMIYNNDRVYEGNWECDYKQGIGFQSFPNGSVYQGNYVNGKPEGVGKYSWPNGEFYEGQWINGLKHGSGMWKGSKGDSYIGEWKMGKADGFGVHVWINGDRYEGNFKQCLKHGQGIEKFANDDLYKGEYFKGKPNGYGEYYWANGSYFKGTFKEGLREGHGMWKKGAGNSDKYQGEYVQDKKQGYGIFTWASGNIFKGHYLQDMRSGFGEMYWCDGSYYKGQWKNGIQHGQGLIFVPGQGIKKGLFKDNVLVQIYQEEQPTLVTASHKPGNIQKNMKLANHINEAQLESIKQKQAIYKSVDNRRKANTTYQAKNIRISRDTKAYPPQPQPPKPMSFKAISNKSKFTAEIERSHFQTNVQQPAQQKKDKIPHSAYYMHKLHKRVSTAQNESQSSNGVRSRDDIVSQLKNFTRKMVGSRISRLSSHQN